MIELLNADKPAKELTKREFAAITIAAALSTNTNYLVSQVRKAENAGRTLSSVIAEQSLELANDILL